MKRTKLGQFMYNITYKFSAFIDKHSWLYWLLILANGILETIIGCVIALGLILLGHRAHRNHSGVYFIIGNNWGGFSMGFVSVIADNMGETYTTRTIAHECGHSYQVCLFGILWFFVVGIPSQIRYLRDCYCKKNNKLCPEYDSIWFEGEATDFGRDYCIIK